MCLIIQRPAGVTLDKDKFLTATKNNPDGYGLTVAAGDGKLLTFKSIEYDADELYDLIHGEFKESVLMLHLRYTTAGDTSLRNAHPFPILERGPDGVDLRMAHNGTIHKYKPGINANNKWESDTRVFAREFVRPLFKRMSAGWHCEDILEDGFVYDLLKDQIPSTSVLAFLDGDGHTMIINAEGNNGFTDEDGVYFSNKYSFNPTHRSPTTTTPASSRVYSGYNWNGGGRGSDLLEEDEIPFGGAGESTRSNVTKIGAPMADTKQTKFSTKYDCDADELSCLTDELLDEIVDEKPEDAKLLIRELMALWQEVNLEATALRAKLKNLTKGKAA